jgi:rubrerythrin
MDETRKKINELNEMIEFIVISIPREIASQKYYQKAAEKTSSQSTRKFFQHFVEEEKSHEAHLKKILNDLRNELKELRKSK